MTNFDTLIQNIETLENQAYSLEFNASVYLLSEKEVVKKILKSKNPKLTDEEVNYMVGDEEAIEKSEEEKSTKEDAKRSKTKKNKEDKKKETEEEKKIRETEQQKAKEERKKRRKEKIEEYKRIVGEKLKDIYEEAKEILREVKAAIFRLIKDIKDISKKFVTSTIQTFSSIPGIVLTITAPPWNIPIAISMTMVIVDTYIELLNRTKNVIPFLSPLRLLPLVTDKKNLSVLSSILNVPVKILLALWAPIMAFGDLIKKLIESILSVLKNRRQSIFRKATARLRSLGHIPHNPESIGVAGIEIKPYGDRTQYTINNIRVYAYSQEDAEEVADLLSTFRIDSADQSNVGSNNKVVAYKSTLSDELEGKLESLNDQLSNTELNFPDTINTKENQPSGSSSFVFDVELPDGSKLYGISEEQLEDLKLSYNIVMKELSILEQSFDVNDSKIAEDLLNFNKTKFKESQQVAFIQDTSILTPSATLSINSGLTIENASINLDSINSSTLSQNFTFLIR